MKIWRLSLFIGVQSYRWVMQRCVTKRSAHHTNNVFLENWRLVNNGIMGEKYWIKKVEYQLKNTKIATRRERVRARERERVRVREWECVRVCEREREWGREWTREREREGESERERETQRNILGVLDDVFWWYFWHKLDANATPTSEMLLA